VWLLVAPYGASAEPAPVVRGYEISFPRDTGSHPQFRTEWWYITGWVEDDRGQWRGFQVTFFRFRNEDAEANPSTFAPTQLLFVHAAVSDPVQGRLLHTQRSARAGFGLAEAKEEICDVRIDDWYLRARGNDYETRVVTDDFALELRFTTTQAPLLQGDRGFSRKGPNPAAASYYYSLPHLRVSGWMTVKDRRFAVRGAAWFDHEWSSEYLAQDAQGWDWIGINLNDGGALMAFRIRDRKGGQYWAAGTLRTPSMHRTFEPEEVEWTPLQYWQSPRTGVRYPVAWRVQLGDRAFTLRPLMEDQESDSRASVGALYWEGAVEAMDESGRVVGRGYLELTGYQQRLKM
jgi:predicted secreted hydrolase